MKVIGRWRPGGCLVALLAVVLLIAPTVSCLLSETGEHTHALPAATHSRTADGLVPFTVPEANSHVHLHALGEHSTHCAGPHGLHCLVEVVLPAGGANSLPLQLIALLLAGVMAAVAGLHSSVRPGRGPPSSPALIVGGRDLLTHLCIARR